MAYENERNSMFSRFGLFAIPIMSATGSALGALSGIGRGVFRGELASSVAMGAVGGAIMGVLPGIKPPALPLLIDDVKYYALQMAVAGALGDMALNSNSGNYAIQLLIDFAVGAVATSLVKTAIVVTQAVLDDMLGEEQGHVPLAI